MRSHMLLTLVLSSLLAAGASPPTASPRPVLTARTPGDLAHALRARDLLRHRGIELAAPGMAARVVRTAPGEALERWDARPERRLVFFFGPDGFARLTRDASDRNFLAALGYPDAFVADHLRRGTRFQLVAFRVDPERLAPATWDGLASALARAYGEPVSGRYRAALPELRRARGILPFVRAAGASLAEASVPGHPAHITAARLAALPAAEVQAWQVRYFLALEANVNELFAGDGVTRLPDGTRGLGELVGLNGRLDAAGETVIIRLRP